MFYVDSTFELVEMARFSTTYLKEFQQHEEVKSSPTEE